MVFDCKYPVMTVAKKGYLYFARTEEELTSCTYTGWKNGHFNDLKIVDSNGNRYTVKEAKPSGQSNVLQKLKMLVGAKFRVELIGDPAATQLSLVEFKEFALKQLKKNRSFFDAGGTYQETIEYVNNAQSIEGIISHLTSGFYKTY